MQKSRLRLGMRIHLVKDNQVKRFFYNTKKKDLRNHIIYTWIVIILITLSILSIYLESLNQLFWTWISEIILILVSWVGGTLWMQNHLKKIPIYLANNFQPESKYDAQRLTKVLKSYKWDDLIQESWANLP